MAFDQTTRGRLQKLVNSCRGLLSEEFSIQLQQTYGLDPKTGEVTPMARLTHLDDRQRHTADVLRQILAHYLGADIDDVSHRIAVLDRMVREQAFTVLNRMAALLMMEARGQLIESVSKGYQSRGYQLYSRVAGTALGETGQAYQVYLFSVFDELAQELPALFDRYSANGLLFPRETALRAALEELNHFEIQPLWAEDETIGWIYQYFNSKEERKAMRDASQAPRNSRELAVRNQFFTPRYVVEFLVDNTLGRLWFNGSGGQTNLRAHCRYLVVKPDEQTQTAAKLRDPRTLKLLDPACGSMHFGLYAFDLFLEIYHEAWAWEQQHGPGSLDVSTQSKASHMPLSQTYADQDAYSRDVPRLIIEHNIYGVDIDPRAAQIATLALWLRAQRAWHDDGVKAKERPRIGRGHVIAAVAPPAERELCEQFCAKLDTNDAELFKRTLEMLKSLPELGVLLQVEKELPSLIRQVHVGKGSGLFAEQEHENWSEAEIRLREALSDFAKVSKSTFQGKLFAQDALDGFRFIDLSHEQFDVLVMNPPFGEPARSTKPYLEESLPRSRGNILTHFIERATEVVRPGGRIGAIVSRTCFFLQSFSNFRKSVLSDELSLESFADLGQGVLDAMVETAAATWERSSREGKEAYFFRELNRTDKSNGLLESIRLIKLGSEGENYFKRYTTQFAVFPDSPYVYWIDSSISKKIANHPVVDPTSCSIRVGLQTGDDFRFLRLWWEVNGGNIVVPTGRLIAKELQRECLALTSKRRWAWYSKTESASPILSSIHACVNWKNDGEEIKAFHISKGDTPSRYVRSETYYFLAAISYMVRSSRIFPYLIPAGVIPTAVRSQVYPHAGNEMWLAALLSSNLATAVARFRGGTFAQPMFQNSMVSAVPYIEPKEDDIEFATQVISNVRAEMAERFERDETEILFISPTIPGQGVTLQPLNRETLIGRTLDNRIAELCGLTSDEFEMLQRDHNEALVRIVGENEMSDEEDYEGTVDATPDIVAVDDVSSLLSWAIGVSFGRFNLELATQRRKIDAVSDPFDPLPAISPAMVQVGKLPFHKGSCILVDEPGHVHDLPRLAESALERVGLALPADVRNWLRKDFFVFHLQRYSRSRRKAPIYWPISTTSGSYTLWIYYPTLNNQTLFTVINDFLDGPTGKLTRVCRECSELRIKGTNRSRDEERQYEILQSFERELTDLRDTLIKIAPNYQPNHDDGVQITAAPLWPLFRYKPWQKVLKDTWSKLEKGDYDWAHLAMAYWPDRVREKCRTDKSLAIAHGLEDLYVEPEAAPKKTRGKKKTGGEE